MMVDINSDGKRTSFSEMKDREIELVESSVKARKTWTRTAISEPEGRHRMFQHGLGLFISENEVLFTITVNVDHHRRFVRSNGVDKIFFSKARLLSQDSLTSRLPCRGKSNRIMSIQTVFVHIRCKIEERVTVALVVVELFVASRYRAVFQSGSRTTGTCNDIQLAVFVYVCDRRAFGKNFIPDVIFFEFLGED